MAEEQGGGNHDGVGWDLSQCGPIRPRGGRTGLMGGQTGLGRHWPCFFFIKKLDLGRLVIRQPILKLSDVSSR